MSIRQIIQLERPNFSKTETTLRCRCEEVTDFGGSFQEQVDDLIETLLSHKIAVGLAAPQIGIPFRFCAINLKQEDSKTLVLVNPKLISNSGKKDKKKESCMSLPHFRGPVERREKIQISFLSRNGDEQIMDATGFLSRTILHEIDHLEGILYIDKVSDLSTLEQVSFFKS